MNRRDFLTSTFSGAASLVLPTWTFTKAPRPRERDLRQFCGDDDSFPKLKVTISTPFVQELPSGQLFRFATDTRICVRVDGQSSDKTGDPFSRPPASSLPWSDSDKLKWHPWPKLCHLIAANPCDECESRGWLEDFSKCPACNGKAVLWLPTYQPIGGRFIASKFDEKIRHYLGECEYNISQVRPSFAKHDWDVIRFRFDGGQGMVAVADPEVVKRQIKTG